MDFDYMRGVSVSGCDFGFAFNDSKFSDRLIRIEIMGGSSDCAPDGEGCTNIVDWVGSRKRRREDIKEENALDLSLCPEEQVLVDNQPGMNDHLGCENQDEETVAMVEETQSGNRSSFSRILAGQVKSGTGQVRYSSGSGRVTFSSDRCQFRSKQFRSEAVKKQVNSGSDGLQADLVQIGSHHWQIKFRSDLYQIRIEFKSG
ncbi:hypothetical protein F3Y22_tig00113725pilonHSYRG01651 [Hibiscus syriacus]|uniref:Uncharacterized protein n=1 Tax=Hibiscus syriacus TaxID=106335 RepID=A0A6A2WPG6_HIBSY|nr:hypothetical protein F3Y22_tig00113725pilonHSYRG01651 [Hibiscus syriacus]